jgi:short subunit dehydrogenase-like uncharacterized protein
MSKKKILIYGANGYSARLMLEIAKSKDLDLIVAGRNESKIKQLAEKYKWEYRVFEVTNLKTIKSNLKDVSVLLNCAGPFTRTFKKFTQACLDLSINYLDITGEIPIFESAAKLHQEAIQSKIMIMPGVGFDVVPTDCLALYLKEKMPLATHLNLAFLGLGGGISHGTATTILENFNGKSAIRKNGKIQEIGQFEIIKNIDYSDKFKNIESMAIPWGDISTAYYSTGINNIQTFVPNPVKKNYIRKILNKIMPVLTNKNILALGKKWVNFSIDGPDKNKRTKAKTYIWGQVLDSEQRSIEARLVVPEGYTLTALAALEIAMRVSKGKKKNGFQTPSMVFGSDFIMQFKGVTRNISK